MSPGSAAATTASSPKDRASAGLVVGLAEQCGKGGRRELAADGERGPIGSEHGEALQLAHEVALRLVHVAQGPAGGQAIDLLDEGEVVLDGRARGERCGHGLTGESLGIEHVDALIEELRRVRSLLGETLVDLSGPAQRGFARIPAEYIVDGRSAREHPGNDGEQTEQYETGHHQPIARPDFGYRTLCHGASPTKIRMEAYRRAALRAGERSR